MNMQLQTNIDSLKYKKTYFQIRESPAPLNIPTPTPAPDRSGPVAKIAKPHFLNECDNSDFENKSTSHFLENDNHFS